jgi:hypothetical protein
MDVGEDFVIMGEAISRHPPCVCGVLRHAPVPSFLMCMKAFCCPAPLLHQPHGCSGHGIINAKASVGTPARPLRVPCILKGQALKLSQGISQCIIS